MQWYRGNDHKGGGATVWEHTPAGEVLIADCGRGALPLARMRLNAQLVALAPEMLAALQWVVTCCDPDGDAEVEYKAAAHAIGRAKEIIAKALTGQ